LGSGVANLGGTLNVQLIDGFTPMARDTFAIITAAEIQRAFEEEILPSLADGLQWSVAYQPANISVVIDFAGDFDLNLDVDAFDFFKMAAWVIAKSAEPNRPLRLGSELQQRRFASGSVDDCACANGSDAFSLRDHFGRPLTAATNCLVRPKNSSVRETPYLATVLARQGPERRTPWFRVDSVVWTPSLFCVRRGQWG
jgi:hypothetical protein